MPNYLRAFVPTPILCLTCGAVIDAELEDAHERHHDRINALEQVTLPHRTIPRTVAPLATGKPVDTTKEDTDE